jgi:hypothetical protein
MYSPFEPTQKRWHRRRAPHSPFAVGQRLSLSPPRRFIGDLMRLARRVPSIPMERRMRLADVAFARRTWPQRVSWCALFMKAYSIVSADRPELRRSYVTFPWPHLYEHPANIATFSLERPYEGEDAVFFAQVPRPELYSLFELDRLVRKHKAAPVQSVETFRRALWVSKLPLPVRRSLWSMAFADGYYRARVFGTFAISVVASLGAAGLHILSPLTTTINYGAFEPDFSLDVRLTYDHRVLDGGTVARAMVALEEVLHGEILKELRHGPPEILAHQPLEELLRQQNSLLLPTP